MKASQIIAFLPKLSRADLATVKAAAEHLLGGLNSEANDHTYPLFEAVRNIINSRISFLKFKTTNSFREWDKNASGVIQFIDETFPNIGKTTRMAMMTYLVGALADDLKERGVPVTIGTMSSNLGRLPEVFEDAFPNYRGSGLVHLIVKSMERRGK